MPDLLPFMFPLSTCTNLDGMEPPNFLQFSPMLGRRPLIIIAFSAAVSNLVSAMAHSLTYQRQTRHRRSSSVQHQSSFETQYPGDVEDEDIPSGIVGDRIRQLRKIAKKESPDELSSPTSLRERESTTLG